MIIIRTPYRVSFLGGGTDFPAWYQEHPGAVLATAINKYCWTQVRWLPPFFEHKHRIVYSRVEEVFRTEEINHPAVREVIKYLAINGGLEVHHDGDLPGRSGMGTSSSFAVGLLHGLNRLLGRSVDPMYLTRTAILVEQRMMKENVGAQDQTTAAFGGFNRVDFHRDILRVTPAPADRLKDLHECLILFFTGMTRISTQVVAEQVKQIPNREKQLTQLYHLVNSGLQVLCGDGDILEFGRVMHEGWQLKRLLSRNVTTSYIDHLYEEGIKAGAVGGKLLGAGGGGFILFMAPPDRHSDIREAMGNLLEVPFSFESTGSTVIFEDES